MVAKSAGNEAGSQIPEGAPTLVAPPHPGPGATPEEIAAWTNRVAVIDAFNNVSLTIAQRMASDDVKMGVARFVVLIALCSITALAGVALLLAVILRTDQVATIITSGSAFVAVIVAGFIMNPLQTIERDLVFRRWSDTIRTSYVVSVADGQASGDAVRAAGQAAATQFAALAKSYSALVTKDRQAVIDGASAKSRTAAAASGLIAITNPGPQSNAVKVPLTMPLQLTATGPSDLKLNCTTAPAGITFDPETKEFSGTPIAAGKSTVVVDAASTTTEGTTASIQFTWTVTSS